VRAPGVASSYSNYGIGLLQLAVETVTTEPFEDYATREILTPLGMTRTTFRDAFRLDADDLMDDALAADIAGGYVRTAGRNTAVPFIHVQNSGVGGAWSTAQDMSRFMRALLGDGSFEGGRILKAETLRRMRTRLFPEGLPDSAGWAHGFMDETIGGARTLGHGGAVIGFLANMVMVPELGLGIFLAVNEEGSRDVVVDIPDLIVRRLTDAPDVLRTPPEGAGERAAELTGSYMPNRRAYRGFEKLAQLAGGTEVAVDDDGYLLVSSGGTTTAYVEIGPDLYRAAEGDAVIAFDRTADGSLILSTGTSSATRVGFLAGGGFFFMLLGAAVILSMTSLLFAWARRFQRRPAGGDLETWSALMPLPAAAVTLVFAAVFVTTFSATGSPSGLFNLLLDYPTVMTVASRVFGFGVGIAAIGMLISLWPLWTRSGPPLSRRIHHTLFAAVLAIFSLVLVHWQLIGFA
jgi:hypothetical protein